MRTNRNTALAAVGLLSILTGLTPLPAGGDGALLVTSGLTHEVR